MSQPDIYRDELLKLRHGYPLFEPDPGDEVHVQVGDVGYINRDTGHFHRLFNPFYSETDPINTVNGVPEHFEPFSDDLKDTYLRGSLPVGSHSLKNVSMISTSLDMEGAIVPAGASFQLSCSGERGAILIIKEPAQNIESKKAKRLGRELLRNYQTWYSFLCRVFGDDVDLREMVFVTGCARTSDWATATFQHKIANGNIRFTACDPRIGSASLAAWGKWDSSVSVPARCGPDDDQRRSHLEGAPRNNQCIFLRGWRVSRRVKPLMPKVIRAGAQPKDDNPYEDNNNNELGMVSLASLDDMSHGNPTTTGSAGDCGKNVESYDAAHGDIYDKAFEKLHEEHSDNDIVILHDDDVIQFIKSKDSYLSSPIRWKCDQLDTNDEIEDVFTDELNVRELVTTGENRGINNAPSIWIFGLMLLYFGIRSIFER